MIHNVPYKYSAFELEEDVEKLGFRYFFDCLYLPRQKKLNLNRNLGYAFINFLLPEHALHFMQACAQHKFKWHGAAVRYKRATVSAAYCQGLSAMLEKANELMRYGGLELVSVCFRVKKDPSDFLL